MRKRNWREYNKKLVQRGSLTFLIDPKIIKILEFTTQKKKKGRPLEFSDQLILLLLMIRIHCKMHYRMLEGFARFFFEQFKKMKIPTYSLMCKRAKELSTKLPKLSSCRPKTIIVDATEIKVQGEGELKVKVHGKGRPKLVIGDGAYDDRDVRDLIREKGGKGLISRPSNAVCHATDLERDDAIKLIRAFGGDKIAKSIWGKLSGYSRRALVETVFSRYKKMFGERAFSRTHKGIILENRLKCVLLNKMIRAAV